MKQDDFRWTPDSVVCATIAALGIAMGVGMVLWAIWEIMT